MSFDVSSFCHEILEDIQTRALRLHTSKASKKQPIQKKQETSSPVVGVSPRKDNLGKSVKTSARHSKSNSITGKIPIRTPKTFHSEAKSERFNTPAVASMHSSSVLSPRLTSPRDYRSSLESFLQQFNLWAYRTEDAVLAPSVISTARRLWDDLKSGKEKDWSEYELLLLELQPVYSTFDSTMQRLYQEVSGSTKGSDNDSVTLKAKLRLTNAVSTLSVKKLLELRTCNPPVPDLEAICLAVQMVLFRLDAGALAAQSYTWRSFLSYLQQPSQVLGLLRDTPTAIETGVLDRGKRHIVLIQNLKDKHKRVHEKNLRDFDTTGAGLLLYEFVGSAVGFADALLEQKTRAANPPSFLTFVSPERDMPSRRKLLTSLYQRMFQPVQSPYPSSYQSEEMSRIRESPGRVEEDGSSVSLKLSFIDKGDTSLSGIDPPRINLSQIEIRPSDDSFAEQFLHNLSFRAPDSDSVPAADAPTSVAAAPPVFSPAERSPLATPKQRSPQVSNEAQPKVAKTQSPNTANHAVPKPPSPLKVRPRKRNVTEEITNRSKSSGRITSKKPIPAPDTKEKELSAIGMKYYWELEDAFRKFLQQKLTNALEETVVEAKNELLREFAAHVKSTRKESSSDHTEMQLAKEQELFKAVSEEMRYKEEVRQASLILARHRRLKTPKSLNWTQQQLLRDKQKLAQESREISNTSVTIQNQKKAAKAAEVKQAYEFAEPEPAPSEVEFTVLDPTAPIPFAVTIVRELEGFTDRMTDEAKAKLAKLGPYEYKLKVNGGESKGPVELSDGSVYIGQWTDQRRFGQGKLYTADGGMAEGYWNGELHLHGRIILPTGSHYEGEMNYGQKSGFGLFDDISGRVYEGEWRDDKRNGKGTEQYADGSVYNGGFLNDKKNGTGVYKWTSGEVYEGEFQDSFMHGVGKYIWNVTKCYEGQWEKGLMHGKGCFMVDGKEYVGEFIKDKKHGKGVYKWDGNVYEGDFEDDKMHGKGYLSMKGKERKLYAFNNNKRGERIPEE